MDYHTSSSLSRTKMNQIKFILTNMLILSTAILFFSCKDKNIIEFEAAIDEYLFLEKKSASASEIENLKSKFEQIDYRNLSTTSNASRYFYLSSLSLMQKKLNEAYFFITEAYKLSRSDSIYSMKKNIELKLYKNQNIDLDSSQTNINWFNNFDKKKSIQKSSKISSDNNSKIKNIFVDTRLEIQNLFKNGNVVSAIDKCEVLINVIFSLNDSSLYNMELAQLYQDIAILYAKNNNKKEARKSIEKAITLNPSDSKNIEIKKLLTD